MGMFDSVWVDCPVCGATGQKAIEFQSKSGVCTLEDYTLDDVPAETLLGVHPYPSRCYTCEKLYKLHVAERKIVIGYVATLVPETEKQ